MHIERKNELIDISLINGLDKEWVKFLTPLFSKPQMKTLSDRVEQLYKTKVVFPRRNLLWNAFNSCPLNDLKVIILNDEPYSTTINGKPEANGLAFSYTPESDIDAHEPVPLQNILWTIEKTIYNGLQFPPGSADLTRWANQGVLLLNTSLTVEKNKPKSHGKLWAGFSKTLINYISKNRSGLIWMLWGNNAKAMKEYIDGEQHILEARHPSSLNTKYPFRGCSHFVEANKLIEGQNGKNFKIQW